MPADSFAQVGGGTDVRGSLRMWLGRVRSPMLVLSRATAVVGIELVTRVARVARRDRSRAHRAVAVDCEGSLRSPSSRAMRVAQRAAMDAAFQRSHDPCLCQEVSWAGVCACSVDPWRAGVCGRSVDVGFGSDRSEVPVFRDLPAASLDSESPLFVLPDPVRVQWLVSARSRW